MTRLLRFARAVDRMTDTIGRSVSWLALVMVLVGAYNAIVRYLGRFVGWNLSSNLYLELQWYLFSVLFLLAAGYVLKEDAHVRVDVIYGRLSARRRVWIDLLGGLLLLVPFCALTLWASWPTIQSSWAIRELSPDPGGLPRYPLKGVILLAFGLLALQAVAEMIKNVARLRGLLEMPEPASPGEQGEV